MKQWQLYWTQLSQRERVAVLAAGVVLVMFLVYQLIIMPFTEHYASLQKDVSTGQETLRWMQHSVAEINQLRRSGAATLNSVPQGKQFVLGLIERTVKAAHLDGVMKRVQPEGDNGVRVWFDNAVFDDMLHWLDELSQKHGLVVKEITIEKQQSPGLTNVRVWLES